MPIEAWFRFIYVLASTILGTFVKKNPKNTCPLKLY